MKQKTHKDHSMIKRAKLQSETLQQTDDRRQQDIIATRAKYQSWERRQQGAQARTIKYCHLTGMLLNWHAQATYKKYLVSSNPMVALIRESVGWSNNASLAPPLVESQLHTITPPILLLYLEPNFHQGNTSCSYWTWQDSYL